MLQHIIILANALFNIRTDPTTPHIQRIFEGTVCLNIILKMVSNTIGSCVASVGFQLSTSIVALRYIIFLVFHIQVPYVHSR